ncbi:helicase-associated domain-containing protein [Paenibacillus sp. CC-CFT747]|nr:helicase-associated domain-containing protein [Paenibacillus sp. CC-CFT747]
MGIPIDQEDQTLSSFESQWLKPMAGMGWMEQAERPDGTICFRRLAAEAAEINRLEELEEEEKEAVRWYVQPDLEVIVPPGISHELLWELELMAHRVGSDDCLLYRLTRETWLRTLAGGRSAERLIRFLDGHAVYGLPGNVELILREWGGEQGISSGTGGASPLYQELGREGASNPCSLPEPAASRGEKRRHTRPSIRKASVQAVAPWAPEWEEERHTVPAMWLKECRPYHFSTMKEMIRQAAEWKTFLYLKDGGTARKVLPKKLHEEKGRWRLEALEGNRMVVIPQKETLQLQILLPETGDS